MSNAKRLPEKDPGETVPLCFDFTDDLGEAGEDSPGVSIGTMPDVDIVVDQSLWRGADSAVASMLVGSPQVSGNQVIQAVAAGVHGVDYKVRCAVNVVGTSPTIVLYKTSIVPVRVQ